MVSSQLSCDGCGVAGYEHDANKGSKRRKARICRAVCTDQPRIIDPNMPNVRIYKTILAQIASESKM